ncbi:hypothetical protein [Neorhizobium sp. T6_25]|uniref:hypothetical protein n=1 Tax=Neorhizobium sp. T6_25 TaxID=2093833 RepID=UPI000CF920F9|nr:hypothetical protein [Neorhizobium sp. T6_25]
MADLLTCREAAQLLNIDLLNLVDILAVGDIVPTEPDGLAGSEVWARNEEIRLCETDIDLIKAELRRRQFADFKRDYVDVYQQDEKPGARGLEFGPGWLGVLTAYADGLRALNAKWNNSHAQLRWGKEKFGALHLYSDYLLATKIEVINLHREAYKSSLQTCQECGLPARLRFGHSICLTLCDRHKHTIGEPDPTRDGIILDLNAWMLEQRD